ncbi:hypothetical protein BS639_22025 [Rouxiella silvae]|uniref:Acyltransferase 3 domain-containing protein n=1 Tax=Rouxiella silvae TaxID=1646373 RepID=A0ABX3TV23_9GAMM|nr:acyltransferase [Rouxiella silvae]ORJ19064.1 hypothetical protein BS639_22025 [Rouxiella silvae]
MGNTRVDYIDGVRGVSALMVVIYHFYWEALPAVSDIRSLWTASLMNGPLCVALFFILSGDSISIGFLKRGSYPTLVKSFLKRYFRLTFLIVICSFLVFFLMASHLTFNVHAGKLLHSTWVETLLDFEPSLLSTLQFSLGAVYTWDSPKIYNPFLWTMQYELLGSFFVIALLFCKNFITSSYKYAIAFAVIFFLSGNYIYLFFIGMLLAMARNDGFLVALENKIGNVKSILILTALIILNGYLLLRYSAKISGVGLLISSPLIVLCIYTSSTLKGFFSSRVCIFLGKISYPLYMFHFIILITVFSYFTTHVEWAHTYMYSFSAACVLLSILLSMGVEKLELYFLVYLNKFVSSDLEVNNTPLVNSTLRQDVEESKP